MKADITWKQCAQLPTRQITYGTTTVINGKVYCGGGYYYTDSDDEYVVYCYDKSQDNWTTLPPLPFRWFSLGKVNGELVAVGGRRKDCYYSNKDVYKYDEQARKWKQTIPPLLRGRDSSSVVSLQSALVVAGGDTNDDSSCEEVAIFELDTSRWYKTDPLPVPCPYFVSLTSIGDTCYALASKDDNGYSSPSSINRALYASVDDLLQNARCSSSGDTRCRSAWKMIANTPTYRPTATTLGGKLLAIGGKEASKGFKGADMKEIYMYSPSTNSWIYFSDLPAPRSSIAVAVLSPAEILVIGGQCDGCGVNKVYKGTLNIL